MEQKNKVYQLLNTLGIHYEVIDHPAAFTIEELDLVDGVKDNPFIAKNLFLRDAKGKRHFLVVLDKYKTVDLKQLRSTLNTSSLSFASEERLMKYCKLTKGSVTPFGILNDEALGVEVVFDKQLTDRKLIGVHPNDNTATVLLSFQDLHRIIESHGNIMHVAEL